MYRAFLTYLARRLLFAVLLVVVVSSASLLLVEAAPGDNFGGFDIPPAVAGQNAIGSGSIGRSSSAIATGSDAPPCLITRNGIRPTGRHRNIDDGVALRGSGVNIPTATNGVKPNTSKSVMRETNR